VLGGSATRADALAAYGAFSASHARAFAIALRLQRLIPALPPRVLNGALSIVGRERPCRRAFTWYLEQAHPRFAASEPALARGEHGSAAGGDAERRSPSAAARADRRSARAPSTG
jgi:hypothetical protein